MSNFANGYVLTDAGASLMADVESGKTTLKITKLQLGSGKTDSIDVYLKRNSLLNPQNTMIVTNSSTEDIDNVRTCVLSAALMSFSVENGYEASELGIFAQDSSGKEILYGVCYDANPGYIPGKTDGNNTETSFDLRIITTSKAHVELALPKSAEELVALAQERAANAIDAASSAAKSAEEANESNNYAQEAMSLAAGSAANAAEDAATASAAAASASKDAKAAASSAAAALESSSGATAALSETKAQAQQAAASIATATALVTKTEKNSAIVGEQLKQAQALATASAGIQIYLDDDGDLAYRLIE